jgi:hypothetical protein
MPICREVSPDTKLYLPHTMMQPSRDANGSGCIDYTACQRPACLSSAFCILLSAF